jgi:flagellar hook-basal body complex protein FliE
MSDMNVTQLLAQMRTMAAQVEQSPIHSGIDGVKSADKPDFSNLLKQSIDSVNDTQQVASQLSTAFEKGDPNVNLAEVMVALEKASVSFQAMTQVRNKLLTAYQEVMNMPV